MWLKLLHKRKLVLTLLTCVLLLGMSSALAYRFRPQASEIISEEASCSTYKISGQLTDKDGPLRKINLKLITTVDEVEGIGETDADGAYEFSSVTPGDYIIKVIHPETGILLTSKAVVVDTDLRLDITFPTQTSGRTLGGTIYDFNSQTNALEYNKKSARVSLLAEDGKTELRTVTVTTPGYTLTVSDLPDGFYWVQAKSSSGTSNVVGLELNQNYKVFNRNLSINWPNAKKEFLITGTVTYRSGQPVEIGKIQLGYPESLTDFKDGRYKLYSVYAGKYTIHALDAASRSSSENATLTLTQNDSRFVVEHNLIIDESGEEITQLDSRRPHVAGKQRGNGIIAHAQSQSGKKCNSGGISVDIKGSSWQWDDPTGDIPRKQKQLVETTPKDLGASVALFEDGRSDKVCLSDKKTGTHYFDSESCKGQLSIRPNKRYTVHITKLDRKYHFQDDLQGSGTITKTGIQPNTPYTPIAIRGYLPVMAGEMFHQKSGDAYNNDAITLSPPYRLCQKYGTAAASKKKACDNSIDVAAYYLFELDASKIRASKYQISLTSNTSKKEDRPLLGWRAGRGQGWTSNQKQWDTIYVKFTGPNRLDLLTKPAAACSTNDKKACILELATKKLLVFNKKAGCDPAGDINRNSKSNPILSDEVLDTMVKAGKAAESGKFSVTVNCLVTGHRKYLGLAPDKGYPKCGEADTPNLPSERQPSEHCLGKAIDFYYFTPKANTFLRTLPNIDAEGTPPNHWHLQFK